jgi:hypothetical protein
MVNFYSAPALAIKLKFMITGCVGTLHLNRKHIPKIVKEKKSRKEEIIAQHSGPSVCAEMAMKEITVISTW